MKRFNSLFQFYYINYKYMKGVREGMDKIETKNWSEHDTSEFRNFLFQNLAPL